MSITQRGKTILKVLLKSDKPISIKYLSEQTGISKRTIQRELEVISNYLSTCEIALKSKTGVGIWLDADEGLCDKLLELLSTQQIEYDAGNRSDRRRRLLLELLKNKEIQKLYYYSSLFEVSEATIGKDLEELEPWLLNQELILTKKPGSGILLEGKEENYRRAFSVYIDEYLLKDQSDEVDVILEKQISQLSKSGMIDFLHMDIVRKVMKVIQDAKQENDFSLTDNSYMGLILHIAIAVNRIINGETIEENQALIESINEDYELILAKDIISRLEEIFDFEIPMMEVYYVYLHIKGSKHQKISELEGNEEQQNVQLLINDMINAYDKDLGYLLKQDGEFIQGLLAHLQPTLVRLKYGMKIKNPVLEDVKHTYPDIFERCKLVGAVIEKWVEKEIPEEEVGFLAIHFGAAMVRLQEQTEQLRRVMIGVVCASGIGISRLMSLKIEKIFRDRVVVKSYGKEDITQFIEMNTDFFVSNMKLSIAEKDVIQVSTLLSEDDISKIERHVYRYERLARKQEEDTIFSVQLEKVNYIAMQIRTIIQNFKILQVEKSIKFDELVECIAGKLAFVSECKDVIKRDILKRESISSQIFSEFDFALLHCRTKGVDKPNFSVCLTEGVLPFEDSYFNGIKVVFVMLVPEDENVLVNGGILGHISSTLIDDPTFLETIRTGDAEQIRGILSNCLKQYFNQYINKFN